MPQLKPQFGLGDRVKVTTIPPSKKKRKSFFEEYYYGILALEFLCFALFFWAAGMGFYRGILIGLLVATLTAVAWQVRQYIHFRGVVTPTKPAPQPSKAVPEDPLKVAAAKSGLEPIRPAKRAPAPVGPDGKKKFPPSYFPPLRDRKPQQ